MEATSTSPAAASEQSRLSYSRTQRLAGIVILIVSVVVIYGPALRGGWLWDDDFDIRDNLLLRDWSGLGKIWFAPTTVDYYPLKFTVQWIQWHLWGANSLGYHVTNVALHIAGALLFWRLLRRLHVRFAWFGALLFAVHPLAVESVAWMAELKNTLALPPLLLACDAWLDYDESRRGGAYARALAWFIVSLLCKTSGVMLPFAFLLHAIWKRSRISWADVRGAAPFFGVSLVFGIVTLWFQYGRMIHDTVLPVGGPVSRIALAGTTLAFYAWKAVWPTGLMPIYPRWQVDPPTAAEFAPWIILFLLSIWLWRGRTGRRRHALFALGWFVLHLLPFLGFVTISYLRLTWVMDHQAYVSLLAVCALAAGGLELALDRWGATLRPVLIGAATGFGLFLVTMARTHAEIFRDAEIFWTYELRHNPGSADAHNNLGMALAAAGKNDAALEQYATAVGLQPADLEARMNYGNALLANGRAEEGLRELRRAAQENPRSSRAHYNLGLALAKTNHGPEALDELNVAIRLRPDWPKALDTRGALLRTLGHAADGLRDLRQAAELEPASAEIHHDLALTLASLKRPAEAQAEFEEALRLAPDDPIVRMDWAATLAAAGNLDGALEQYREACRRAPALPDAHINLGIASLMAGRPADAITSLEAAVRLDANSARAEFNLGNALLAVGRAADAASHYARAATLLPANAQIEVQLARALAKAGRTNDARAHYDRARELDPTLPPFAP